MYPFAQWCSVISAQSKTPNVSGTSWTVNEMQWFRKASDHHVTITWMGQRPVLTIYKLQNSSNKHLCLLLKHQLCKWQTVPCVGGSVGTSLAKRNVPFKHCWGALIQGWAKYIQGKTFMHLFMWTKLTSSSCGHKPNQLFKHKRRVGIFNYQLTPVASFWGFWYYTVSKNVLAQVL